MCQVYRCLRQGLVKPGEVVEHEVEGDVGGEVLQLPTEGPSRYSYSDLYITVVFSGPAHAL